MTRISITDDPFTDDPFTDDPFSGRRRSQRTARARTPGWQPAYSVAVGLIAACVIVSACSSTDSQLCRDGTRCPEGSVCAADQDVCITDSCGNGRIDDDEVCDDGNIIDADGCSANCSSDETCGNRVIDSALGEICDDGDATNEGTCGADCRVLTSCGDFFINPGEECDTGRVDTPRCNWNCTAARCGDEQVNRAAGEECDEGGDTERCDGDCTTVSCGDFYHNPEHGEECDQGPSSPTCTAVCTPSSCGDFIVNQAAGEECDEGGVATWLCNEDCTEATCGDGRVNQLAGELCDDGMETETCDADCTPAECGDLFVNSAAGEECDEGLETETCDGDCTLAACGDLFVNNAAGEDCEAGGETETCDGDCTFATCGDGHVNSAAGEDCDDGGESAACNADCSLAGCGDGVFNAAAGEACDGGGESAACNADCTLALCGDGQVNATAGEACDDGGPTPYCTNQCEAALSCGQTCSTDSECQSGRCVAGLCQAAFLATGGEHTCTLLDTGEVRCWGRASQGQLGYGDGPYANIGDNETPGSLNDFVDVTDVVGDYVTQLSAGTEHTCALLNTGDVRCWGQGSNGRLGLASTADIGVYQTPGSLASYIDVTGETGRSVIQVAAGGKHTCVLLDNGAVRCWGRGDRGQLGLGGYWWVNIGDNEHPSSIADINVTGGLGDSAVQVVAGDEHTCARLERGAVHCWGYNDAGQLGYGHTSSIGNAETPFDAGHVPVGGSVIQLAAGYRHTCALLDNGAVRCWGQGSDGRLGYGSENNIGNDGFPAEAGDVSLGGPAVQITAGFAHTCALLASGAVRCWGDAGYGQLGHGNTTDIGDDEVPSDVAPVDVVGGLDDRPVEVHAGQYHTCALLDSCRIRCWGRGYYGPLGYGNTYDVGRNNTPADAGDVPYR